VGNLLPFIITGIALGSVYGLAGVGLVLTYKTSGIFNFAHGAMATLAAYLFYSLHVQHGMPWPLAAVISALVLGVALGFGFEAFGRRLSRTSLVWRVGATVGILLSIEALVTIIWGGTTQTFPHFLSISTFNLAGTAVTYEQLITTVVSLAGAIGLWVFFRVARLGKAMRAVVDDPQLLDIAGTNPSRVRRWAWIVGCTFATLSGLLLAPDVSLDSSTLTLLVVQAFGAAAIGGFSSLPLTWAGGIVIGVIGSIATRYGSAGSLLAALGPTLPFIILFLVLVFAPKSRLRTKEVALIRPSIPWSAPPLVQGVGGLIAIVFFLLVPLFAGYNVSQWTIALTDLILLVSLGLLARTAGQVSLCQVGFAAIGASTFSKLAVSAGVPWIPALILAGLVVVPVGALIAIPAVRLGGLYLALATLGFGLLLQDMFYNSSLMFGFGGVGVSMPAPHLSWLSVDSEKGFYYVVLLITVLLVLVVVALERSRTGRLMRAIADSPRALRSGGATVSVTLVLIFCISAFIAAIAGALQGMVFTTVTGQNYDPLSSVLFFAVVLLGVGSAPWYALPTALALVLLPVYIQSDNVPHYLQLAFGVFAVQLAISGQANPAFLQKMHKALDRFRGRTPEFQPSAAPASTEAAADIPGDAEPLVLEAQGLRVQFGGLVAVNDISLKVPEGKIVGLIGANGAGKSTTLDVCSGLTMPTSGKVLLGGR
jgi:branched-subunit amino acid ABC-type transport system permease component